MIYLLFALLILFVVVTFLNIRDIRRIQKETKHLDEHLDEIYKSRIQTKTLGSSIKNEKNYSDLFRDF